MSRSGKLLRLAAVCALFARGPAFAEETKDCKLRVVTSADMQTLPDGRVTIPVQMEGHDYRLMVDTGGYINTVTPALVKQEGYRTVESAGELVGLGTKKLNSFVHVNDFAIGRTHGKYFQFFVDDFNSNFVDGTLAPQILAAYDVDLDFASGKFNLISPDHCPGIGPYWTSSSAVIPIQIKDSTHIRIPVTINGKEIMATVDTGAHTSYITMRAARRFLGIDEKDPALQSRGTGVVNGMASPIYNYPFQSLSFGAVTVNHPHIQMVADNVWGENDLLLGIGILRQLHIYIAYKEKKMYVTPALAN